MKHWMLALALCGLVPLPSALATERDRAAVVGRDLASDRAVVGGRVAQAAPVGGDLLAAGGELEVSAPVGGDALLAGGRVRVRAAVSQGLYVAGGRVAIDAPVQRNVRAAAGSLELGPATHVNGNASIAAGEVRVLGPVDGYLSAAGGRVLIDAAVGGDVEVGAGRIELGPHAAIGGSLRYASESELVRDPSARVAGSVERLPLVGDVGRRSHGSGAGHWIWTAGLMCLAALVAALAPLGYARVLDAVRARPLTALLVGLVALVCVPVAAVILLVTVVGVPLALLILFALPVVLLLGYVSVGVALGAAALVRFRPAVAQRRGWRALFAAAAVLALGVVTWVTWLGALVAVLVLLAGTGALLMALQPVARTGPAPT